MKISAIQTYNFKPVHFQNNIEKKQKDNFEYEYPNSLDYKKTAAYGASIITAGYGLFYLGKKLNISPFAKKLAHSISTATGQKIAPENFACIMSGDELLKTLPKLNKKSYEASPQNMKNGFFKADLHSYSNYSAGNGLVKNLLEDAAEYADFLYKKTKQKFIFALTDQDTLEGVKEALEIIGANPNRYKNLQFVPAMKVSFVHPTPKSSNPCEASELLVYGIDPYSKKINDFLNNTKEKRTQMINNFINDATKTCPLTEFSFKEFSNFYDYEKFGNLANIHWRVNHYVQTKHAITNLAARTHEDPNFLYQKIMQENKGASVGQLQSLGKLPYDIKESPELHSLLKKYEPHIENNKISAQSENSFDEVIDAFQNEKNVFMAFAHPAFLDNLVKNPYEELQYFIKHSKGLIKASESFYQKYPENIEKNKVTNLQTKTEALNLLNIGGRDNDNIKLFQFNYI